MGGGAGPIVWVQVEGWRLLCGTFLPLVIGREAALRRAAVRRSVP